MNVGPFHVISVKDLDDYWRDHILLRYASPGLYQADFLEKDLRLQDHDVNKGRNLVVFLPLLSLENI